MKCQRGTQENTLRAYGRVVKDALDNLGDDPSRSDAESIRTFILGRTKGKSRSNAKEITSVMRMFLRYLIAEGKCRVGMDDAVPTIAMWRLSALPRYPGVVTVFLRLVRAMGIHPGPGCRGPRIHDLRHGL